MYIEADSAMEFLRTHWRMLAIFSRCMRLQVQIRDRRASASPRLEPDGRSMVANPCYHDPWSGAHLLQGCRHFASGFSFRYRSEMGGVSRVDFSGLYQRCAEHAMTGWHGACGR